MWEIKISANKETWNHWCRQSEKLNFPFLDTPSGEIRTTSSYCLYVPAQEWEERMTEHSLPAIHCQEDLWKCIGWRGKNARYCGWQSCVTLSSENHLPFLRQWMRWSRPREIHTWKIENNLQKLTTQTIHISNNSIWCATMLYSGSNFI